MKYDDLTLIKFTDGELETSLTKEIENAALSDHKLEERLKIISLMSNEKIILAQKYGQKLNQKIADILISEEMVSDDVPSHVVDLVKNFKPSFKQRLEAFIYNVKTKYKSLNILAVDDVEINRKLLKGQLEQQSWRTFLAGNGQEALDILYSEKIDLVLMDIHMPVMDGIETTRRIREMPEYDDMKIIGSCAILSTEMREKCLAAGMNTVVEKPLDMSKLSTSIAHLFPDIQGSSYQTQVVNDNEFIAMNIVHDHCATLGVEKVRSLYEEAEVSARRLVSQICAASLDDHLLISGAAHALAGLCSNFGFIALGDSAGQLQQRDINSKHYTAQLQTNVQQLSEFCEDTFLYLSNVTSKF